MWVIVAIKAVVFDLGGILEIIPQESDISTWFPALMARWDARMGWVAGTMASKLTAQHSGQRAAGKGSAPGSVVYDEWRNAMRTETGWDDATLDSFIADYWETYNGGRNPELAPHFISLMGGAVEILQIWTDPTVRWPTFAARWDARMGWAPGTMAAKIQAQDDRYRAAGKDAMLGLGGLRYEEWMADIQAEMGWDDATHDAFIAEYWDMYIGDFNDELAAYFIGLRPRYKTAFLSNSGVGAREHEQAARGFEDMANLIVYSHEVGFMKPDPRIYALTCERLDVQPDEMIFLDNVPGNVAAARQFGIHAVLFQNNAQTIRDIEALLAAHA
jgi:putative hydrolase of the HAD superfamily